MTGRNRREQADLEERRRIVASMNAAGHTAAYIAVVLNVCRKTVERDRVRLGLRELKAPPLSLQELTRARELLDEGCNYAEVGRTINRSPNTLARHLPGYALDRSQISELGAAGRWMARLERSA